MKYIIEKKHGEKTKYSKRRMYLKGLDHIVTFSGEATKYTKGHLSKLYKRFGKDNLILHKVKES